MPKGKEKKPPILSKPRPSTDRPKQPTQLPGKRGRERTVTKARQTGQARKLNRKIQRKTRGGKK